MAERTPLAFVAPVTTQMQTGDVYAFMQWKKPCVAMGAANVVIASALENGDTLDGVTLATGDRVLLNGQTDPKENGVYVVAASGAASRAPDFDAGVKFMGAAVTVIGGTVRRRSVWMCQNNTVPTVGTNNILFAAIAGDANADVMGAQAQATQAEQESGATSRACCVHPGVQHFHPSAAKAFGYFTLSGTTLTLQRAYNCTVSRTGIGLYDVAFSTNFSDAFYTIVFGTENLSGVGTNTLAGWFSRTASGFRIAFTGSTFLTLSDTGANISFACFGDQ